MDLASELAWHRHTIKQYGHCLMCAFAGPLPRQEIYMTNVKKQALERVENGNLSDQDTPKKKTSGDRSHVNTKSDINSKSEVFIPAMKRIRELTNQLGKLILEHSITLSDKEKEILKMPITNDGICKASRLQALVRKKELRVAKNNSMAPSDQHSTEMYHKADKNQEIHGKTRASVKFRIDKGSKKISQRHELPQGKSSSDTLHSLSDSEVEAINLRRGVITSIRHLPQEHFHVEVSQGNRKTLDVMDLTLQVNTRKGARAIEPKGDINQIEIDLNDKGVQSFVTTSEDDSEQNIETEETAPPFCNVKRKLCFSQSSIVSSPSEPELESTELIKPSTPSSKSTKETVSNGLRHTVYSPARMRRRSHCTNVYY